MAKAKTETKTAVKAKASKTEVISFVIPKEDIRQPGDISVKLPPDVLDYLKEATKSIGSASHVITHAIRICMAANPLGQGVEDAGK